MPTAPSTLFTTAVPRKAQIPAVLLVSYLTTLRAPAQQWTVVNLHPDGAAASQANGVADGQQAGNGGYWTGTAESFVSLGPVALVNGVGTGQQAGRFIEGNLRACVWSGAPESRVTLHPVGAYISEATGTHAGVQVGWVGFTSTTPPHASLWTGSAESRVDLHPNGSTFSQAFGVHAGQQVGQARFASGVPTRAALWSGTAASFVDLNPAVGTFSIAYGTDSVQQVGQVQVGTFHAALWRGSAGSFIDLHPPSAFISGARGVAGGEQVGYVNPTEQSGSRATIWSGSAATAMSLHDFLPLNFTSSAACGIWHDAQVTYVVGSGYNNTTGRTEALMWIRCNGFTGDFDFDDDVDLQDLARLLSSFGCAAPQFCDADIDSDGDVDISDLAVLLANFGRVCP